MVLNPLPAFGGGPVLHHLQGVLYILENGEDRNQVKILKHKTDILTPEKCRFPAIQTGDIVICHLQRTVGRGIEAADHIQKGGFSAAGRTHKGNKGARLDRKINVLNGVNGDITGGIVFFRFFATTSDMAYPFF